VPDIGLYAHSAIESADETTASRAASETGGQ
jgi:hypothetical protein